MKRLISVIVLSGAFCVAQQPARWTTPRLGVVFDDSSRQFRALEGVPGSASLGRASGLDAKIADAWVAPVSRYAIARLLEGGAAVVRLATQQPAGATMLANAVEPDRVVFSRSGGCAALASTQRTVVQVWCGLPAAPALRRELDSAGATGIAVTDQGDAAISSSTSIRVWRGNSAPVTYERSASALAADGDSLIAVCGRDIVKLSPGAQQATIAVLREDLGTPSEAALSPDGSALAVLTSGGMAVVRLPDGAATATISAGERTRLLVLSDAGVFAAAGSGAVPLLIVDAPAGAHSIVPAGGTR